MSARTIALALVVLAAPGVGCLSSDGGENVPAGAQATNETDSSRVSSVEEPTPGPVVRELNLSVGDHFHHETTWSGEDVDLAYDAIVVEEGSTSWQLATDNRTAAILASIQDGSWFTLGSLAKGTLAPQGEDAWLPGFYELPLENGSTWTREVEYGNQTYSVTFDAAHEENASTPLGPRERFLVEARTADDELFLRYDLVPEIGWFSKLSIYDPGLNGSLEERRTVRIETTAVEANWTGTYLAEKTEMVHGQYSWLSPGVPPSPSDLGAEPAGTFEVPGSATYVFGWLGAWASAGAWTSQLADPNGTTYRYTATSAAPEGASSWTRLTVEAVPGTWHVEMGGAGAAGAAWASLWTVTEEQQTLE